MSDGQRQNGSESPGYPPKRPRSALNLRLFLAVFGFLLCAALAAGWFAIGETVPGALLAAVAAIALVNMIVVQWRRTQRRRREPGRRHSIFE